MTLETFLNVYMLFTAVTGLFLCLYHYVKRPNKIWAYASLFFLAHFLSDYYWTIYILIMNDYPNTSAFLAYFGWNIAFIFLFLISRSLQSKEEKNYFNVLFFLPIPLNIAQFCLYIPFGGILNNVWQGVCCTAVACLSIQSVLYYLKNRKNGVKFPWIHFLNLLLIFSEYGMWTSSCFSFKNPFLDPYNYFSFISFSVVLFMARAIKVRMSELYENSEQEEKGSKSGFIITVQGIITIAILGCCFGGYIFAKWLRERLVSSGIGYTDGSFADYIAIILFGISVVLVVILLVLMFIVSKYYKGIKKSGLSERELKTKFNFAFTLSITFILMLFAVVYTSKLLYEESVSSIYGECEDKVSGIADSLSNYLNTSEAVLWVTGDSADQMYQDGDDKETIHDYLRVETVNQTEKFDENFMGFYGVIDGVFMSGIDWIPPEDYNPYERDWYKTALEADGDVAIVAPYVDAQSGDVIISVAKLLSDKKNAVSLDVSLNHIQQTVEEININGNGYGMVIDKEGGIIAHKDPLLNGRNCSEIFNDDAFLNAVLNTRNGRAEAVIDGYRYTIFINEVLNQWYTVVLVKNMELFSEARVQLIVNVGVYLIIFFLITFFYYMSYMNEKSASEMMEELITSKQKQEYEAKVLKLEKSAADDANKAKSRFLADMSHEIRTPINAVLGMNEMILRETDSESIREYANNIRSSGKALLSLINSILDFSKIEDGKMEIVPVDYSVADMIHYLYNSIVERASAKSLSFIVEVDPTIPKTIHGDDMRLSQVIMNLLTNAVKYTREGEVKLSVRNSGISDDNVLLYVEVKDTGIGIKEEDMPKLFESFERLEKEKNRNIEGTGLGMSIVTRLLSMMDSKLSVDSKYGEGSKFSFVIKQGIVDENPVGDACDMLNEGYKKGKAEDTYHESFTAPLGSVLIVDDTKMNLNVARNLLKKTLLNIETALSGNEALELCRDNKYDVILMDQRMPGIDGTETLHLIREQLDGMNEETPVICLTADAISGARDRYLAEGFSDYLTKPIEGRELEKMLLLYLPKNKIIIQKDNADKTDASEYGSDGFAASDLKSKTADAESDFTEELGKIGVDVKAGMYFCQNDKDIYRNIIEEYVKESGEKTEKLQRYFEEKDWKNYGILIHSVKSTSKLIGATGLSQKAEKLEKAANENDALFIEKEHEEAMKEYGRISKEIGEIAGIDAGSSDDSSDDGIMEFLPE